MIQEASSARKREIYSLLCVFVTGLVCAIILTAALTYYYTTEVGYRAKNVLVEPALLPKLRYTDPLEGKGERATYVFHKIILTFMDPDKKGYRTVNLSQRQYEEVYTALSGDYSVRSHLEEQPQLYAFGDQAILSLILWNKSTQGEYTLMRVEVAADGEHYRVQIRDSKGEETWAYFEHPQIMQTILEASRR